MNVCVMNVFKQMPMAEINKANSETGSFHFRYVKGSFSQPCYYAKIEIFKMKMFILL